MSTHTVFCIRAAISQTGKLPFSDDTVYAKQFFFASTNMLFFYNLINPSLTILKRIVPETIPLGLTQKASCDCPCYSAAINPDVHKSKSSFISFICLWLP